MRQSKEIAREKRNDRKDKADRLMAIRIMAENARKQEEFKKMTQGEYDAYLRAKESK